MVCMSPLSILLSPKEIRYQINPSPSDSCNVEFPFLSKLNNSIPPWSKSEPFTPVVLLLCWG